MHVKDKASLVIPELTVQEYYCLMVGAPPFEASPPKSKERYARTMRMIYCFFPSYTASLLVSFSISKLLLPYYDTVSSLPEARYAVTITASVSKFTEAVISICIPI